MQAFKQNIRSLVEVPNGSNTTYVLDWVRAIAHLWVFFTHIITISPLLNKALPTDPDFHQNIDVYGIYEQQKGWKSFLLHVFGKGNLAVDLVFILSGYLAMQSFTTAFYNSDPTGQVKERDFASTTWQFYKNRIYRIYPSYLVFHAIMYLLSRDDRDHMWTNLIFISNAVYDFHRLFMGHMWSLMVDAQFYAVFPLFFLLLRKLKVVGHPTSQRTRYENALTLLFVSAILGCLVNLMCARPLFDSGFHLPLTEGLSQIHLPPAQQSGKWFYHQYATHMYAGLHNRFTAFVGGIALFLMTSRIMDNKETESEVSPFLITASVAAVAMIMKPSFFYGEPWGTTESILHVVTMRPVFSLAITYILYAIIEQNRYKLTPLGKMMSWRVWCFMSRLAYQSFFWNPIILGAMYTGMGANAAKQGIVLEWNMTSLVNVSINGYVLTIAFAVVFYLLIEKPCINWFKGNKKVATS